jgi:tRNA-dihydrouridine synthase
VGLRDTISPNTLLVGNGGVKNYNNGIDWTKKYNLDGAMIATGILSNPWAFDKSDKKSSLEDNKKILTKHLNLYRKTEESNKSYNVLKKFFKMYIRGSWPNQNLINGFDGASKLRNQLMQTKSVDEALKLL